MQDKASEVSANLRRPLIEVRGLGVSYRHSGRSQPISVLNSVDLDIYCGDRVAVLGRSGSGKSTLLRLIAGLETPRAGTIKVDGQNADEARRRRWIGVIAQDATLFGWRTVLENAQLPSEISRDTQMRVQAREMLAAVGLSGFEDAYPHQLSGGMRSRVSIARALSIRPRILLADEPASDLDEITQENIINELASLGQRFSTTMVIVTHSIEEACAIANRIVWLANGQLQEIVPPAKATRFDPDAVRCEMRLEVSWVGSQR
jgi:NitT/TauT family transport system ATP-binding protein